MVCFLSVLVFGDSCSIRQSGSGFVAGGGEKLQKFATNPLNISQLHHRRTTGMNGEQTLVEDILGGNRGAFRALVQQYERLVRQIVGRLVGNDADREDVAQDVFVKVYEHLGEFRGECKLSSWIGRIAYNTALNHVQKKRPELYEDRWPGERTVDSECSGGSGPDEDSEYRDLSRRLHEEIDRLPLHYGIVLTLFHLCDMRYEEIAEVIQLPVGTVKSHLFRGRQALKEQLLAHYDMEELWQSGT
jgi:RNA polymerase sigma-70 factor (ECF subfamily)